MYYATKFEFSCSIKYLISVIPCNPEGNTIVGIFISNLYFRTTVHITLKHYDRESWTTLIMEFVRSKTDHACTKLYYYLTKIFDFFQVYCSALYVDCLFFVCFFVRPLQATILNILKK